MFVLASGTCDNMFFLGFEDKATAEAWIVKGNELGYEDGGGYTRSIVQQIEEIKHVITLGEFEDLTMYEDMVEMEIKYGFEDEDGKYDDEWMRLL